MKGFKKHTISLGESLTVDAINAAILSIDERTESGVKRKSYEGRWTGLQYESASFYAKPNEVEKIKSELEDEFGVVFC